MLKRAVSRFHRWRGNKQMLPCLDERNTYEKVKFREKLLRVQAQLEKLLPSVHEGYPLEHLFTPKDAKYNCHLYARQIFMPKGHIVISKIHKYAHLTFIIKGKLTVTSDEGRRHYEAPCMFVSPAGVKRAIYIEEDTIWTTVHPVGRDDVDAAEAEKTTDDFRDVGLIASTHELALLESK